VEINVTWVKYHLLGSTSPEYQVNLIKLTSLLHFLQQKPSLSSSLSSISAQKPPISTQE